MCEEGNVTVPVVCTTMTECLSHQGERITAVGVYTAYDPYPGRKRDAELPSLVRLAMEDSDEGPFLEAFWSAAAVRPDEERERMEGRRVRVVGTFYAEQPAQPGSTGREATFGGPCIHPVESVSAFDDGAKER